MFSLTENPALAALGGATIKTGEPALDQAAGGGPVNDGRSRCAQRLQEPQRAALQPPPSKGVPPPFPPPLRPLNASERVLKGSSCYKAIRMRLTVAQVVMDLTTDGRDVREHHGRVVDELHEKRIELAVAWIALCR